jgi:hypothetical protein
MDFYDILSQGEFIVTVDYLYYDIARDNRYREYLLIGVDLNAYLVSRFDVNYYDILSQ